MADDREVFGFLRLASGEIVAPPEVLEILKRRDEEFEMRQADRAPIFRALSADDPLAAVEQCLRDDPSAANANDGGKTPLHSAAEDDDVAVIDALVRYGADLNARDTLGRAPLHRALGVGRLKAARKLVASGADTRATDHRGESPIFAAAHGPYEIRHKLVKLLADAGEAVDFHCAMWLEHFHLMEKLLKEDRDAIKKLPHKDRLLCDAVWLALNAIIRAGMSADVLARHEVFEQWRPWLDRIIAEVDVNTVADGRRTALCEALMLGGGEELVEYLAEHGADVNLDSSGGETPLAMARQLEREPEIEVLLRYGAHE
jgi:ankyrin repeat protein